jgi:hypothetical protein
MYIIEKLFSLWKIGDLDLDIEKFKFFFSLIYFTPMLN